MIRDRIVVGIEDAILSVKMQLDLDITLKKATLSSKPEADRKRYNLCIHLCHVSGLEKLNGSGAAT
jgi:hypothetical protein